MVDAHQIVVMEGGRIIEQGSFRDLLDRRGRFAQMWQLQLQRRRPCLNRLCLPCPLICRPVALWRHFATVPTAAPSRHEGQVMDHLCRWASTRSLNWTQDAAGNLLIRKPASPAWPNGKPWCCKAMWTWCASRTATPMIFQRPDSALAG